MIDACSAEHPDENHQQCYQENQEENHEIEQAESQVDVGRYFVFCAKSPQVPLKTTRPLGIWCKANLRFDLITRIPGDVSPSIMRSKKSFSTKPCGLTCGEKVGS